MEKRNNASPYNDVYDDVEDQEVRPEVFVQ
jgi:hypothetical protein